MQSARGVLRILLSPHSLPTMYVPSAGLKNYPPPVSFDNVEYPERNKLKVMPRQPTYPPGMRAFKMQKRLRYMRGPEHIHTELIHKQFGIIATGGGRLKYGHFEMMRLTLLRKFDFNKIFAIWRVDAPWQPVSRKGQGQRMGGGKGAIDHYVTPVKAGRVIVELAGPIEFPEAKRVLRDIAYKLPFAAMAVSQSLLEEMKKEEKRMEEENLHPWNWKYMIQNNIGDCHKWISPFDKIWYNKYR